jgi:hypothetical protein
MAIAALLGGYRDPMVIRRQGVWQSPAVAKSPARGVLSLSFSGAFGELQKVRRKITVCDRLDVLLPIGIDSDVDRDRVAIDIDEEHAVSALDFLDHLVKVQRPRVNKGAAAHMADALSWLPVIGSADALDLDRLLHVFSP